MTGNSLQLQGKLVPHRGIAAILDEATDVFGQTRLSGQAHRSGCSHGDTVDYDTGRANAVAEQLLRHLCPTSYVDAVLPTHLNVIAVTTAMGM